MVSLDLVHLLLEELDLEDTEFVELGLVNLDIITDKENV